MSQHLDSHADKRQDAKDDIKGNISQAQDDTNGEHSKLNES